MEEWKGKTVLVTGGAGFIGSNLVRRLIQREAEVTIIDALLPQCGGSEGNLAGIQDKVTFLREDLRSPAAQAIIKGFDVIFHLAGHLGHKESVNDPFMDLELNATAAIALLESARRQNTNAVIVSTGTRGQYGKIQSVPVTEEHPLLPVDPNGVSKQAAEQYLFLYGRSYGIRGVSCRLTNIYGPRSRIDSLSQGVIGWFVHLALQGEAIKVHGGAQLRDVLYVDDLCDALLLAATIPEAAGEAFNIASGTSISLLEIAKTICKLVGSGTVEVIPVPDEMKSIQIGDYLGDISKASRILGWKPKVPFEEGMRKMIEHCKAQRAIR